MPSRASTPLAFENGAECRAYRKDVNDFLQNAQADLVYFDPPYPTEFSTTNCEKAYHFVEGLMTYWDGLQLVEGSKTRHCETDHKSVTPSPRRVLRGLLGNAQHIPHWLISYYVHPNEREMRVTSRRKGSRRRCVHTITTTPSPSATAMLRMLRSSSLSAGPLRQQ